MVYIKLLEPVIGSYNNKELKVEPLWFYGWIIDNDDSFNTEGKGIRASVRIDAAIKKASTENSKYLKLETEDKNMLQRACEKPSGGYPFRPVRLIHGFINAVGEATEEEPKEESEEASVN